MQKTFNKIKPPIGRQTKTKKAILNILSKNKCLLSKKELVKELEKQKITPNRSTIYRELKFLEKNNIILKNIILGSDYYEMAQNNHHHIICLKCNKIENFDICKYNLVIKNLKNKIQEFAQITNHSFELFGICNSCNKK